MCTSTTCIHICIYTYTYMHERPQTDIAVSERPLTDIAVS